MNRLSHLVQRPENASSVLTSLYKYVWNTCGQYVEAIDSPNTAATDRMSCHLRFEFAENAKTVRETDGVLLTPVGRSRMLKHGEKTTPLCVVTGTFETSIEAVLCCTRPGEWGHNEQEEWRSLTNVMALRNARASTLERTMAVDCQTAIAVA